MTNIYTTLIIEFATLLIVPVISRKLHIPAIVGFICTGILLGPHALNIITNSNTIDTIGKLGILYIMFQVGIDLDKNVFHHYKIEASIFGFFSFLFPFALGLFTGLYVLNYTPIASTLIGAVLGSHTLMTYPIIAQYGIQRHSSINIVIGGTIVAVTLSLTILTLVKDKFLCGEILWGKMIIMTCLFILFSLIIMPNVLHFVLKRNKNSQLNFMLVMLCLISSARLAEIAGLDSILGAYVCGLALNGLVPQRSSLMSKIHFIGNSFLVPLFLISVGMIINVSASLSNPNILLIALLLIATKLIGKGLATISIKTIKKLPSSHATMIWGMTQAASAGTIAILTIGFQIGIFNINILNAGIIMICTLCTTASFITEHCAKKILLQEYKNQPNNYSNNWLLLSLQNKNEKQIRELASLSHMNEIEEAHSNSWNEIYQILNITSKNALLYQCKQPLNTIQRIITILPKNAEKENGFLPSFDTIRKLSGQIGSPVIFYANQITQQHIINLCNTTQRYLRYSFRDLDDWEDMLIIVKKIKQNDLIILFTPMPNSPNYNPLFNKLPSHLNTFFSNLNYLVIFPNKNSIIPSNPSPYYNNKQHEPNTKNTFHKLIHNLKKKLQYG